jgi:hypothetical protein
MRLLLDTSVTVQKALQPIAVLSSRNNAEAPLSDLRGFAGLTRFEQRCAYGRP